MSYFEDSQYSTQYDKPCYGVLRITNQKTLERWKANGKYQELIDSGYIYAEGCGRFRTEPCTCSKCRNKKNNNLIKTK